MQYSREIVTLLLILLASSHLLLYLIKRFTNVSIRRFGYLSLRHIDLPLPAGLAIHIGFAGIRFRRPTITKPTWASLIIQNVEVTVNLDVTQSPEHVKHTSPDSGIDKVSSSPLQRFNKLAMKVKKLSSYRFMRWIDFILIDTTLKVKDCGTIQLGMLQFRVIHKRRKGERRLHIPMAIESDISTLLSCEEEPESHGIEAFIMLSNLRFQLQEEPRFEVMDSLIVNLWTEFGSATILRNTGLSLKFGKLQLVLDDLVKFLTRLRPAPSNMPEEPTMPRTNDSHDEAAAVSDFSFLFDILTEVQIHVGFLKASYQAQDVTPAGKPAIVTATAKDAVFDINRLDQGSPDYRMLFETGIVAHQALISLISFSVQMSANDCEETILSIPMMTLASKTSTPAFLLQQERYSEGDEQKNNLTTLNAVVTSPSSNINALQIPILLALLRPRASTHSQTDHDDKPASTMKDKLPRFDFSFGVHDPSIRVVLESHDADALPAMIIGRLSSFYMEAHARHTEYKYAMNTTMRVNAGRLYYHSPDNVESDVLTNNHASLGLECALLPMSEAHVTGVLDGFQAELSRPEIVECFTKITESMHSPEILPAKLPSRIKHKQKSHPLSKIPAWLEGVKWQAKNFSVLVSGIDHEVAYDSRGMKLIFDDFLIDYGKDELITMKNDTESSNDFYKGHISDFSKQDVSRSGKMQLYRKVLATMRTLRMYTVDSGTILDKKHPILVLPLAEIAVSQSTDKTNDLLHIGYRIEDVVLGFSLFKVYAVLQALRVLQTSFVYSARTANLQHTAEDQASSHDAHEENNPGRKLQITMEGKINLLRLKARLPLGENQMIDLDHVRISKGVTGQPQLRMRYARIYIESPSYAGRWDRIVSIRDVHLTRETHTEKSRAEIVTTKALVIRSDAMRIRIPHQFVFYKMLESIINSLKTTTQIVHRFVTNTNDYVLAQHPKQAKALPRVRVKSRMLTLEVEDDPFEARLGLIFRVGLSEQRMREAREVAFDRKVVKLREAAFSQKNPKVSQHPTNGHRTVSHAASSVRSGQTGTRLEVESIAPSEDRASSMDGSTDTNADFPHERERLLQHNSRAWISRIQYALSFRHKKMNDIRQQKWGKDEISHAGGHTEVIMEASNRPPLFSIIFTGIDLQLDKPSFPLDQLPQYIHRVGRGMPLDTKYSLLIPISLRWKMDEARINVRDYPLPLLHIPPIHASQRIKASAWDFSTDLVIAEEFPDMQAIRHIDVNVIPANTGREGSPAFNVEVQRTASSVKTYAEMSIDLNSTLPTRVHWGTSMQPGVGDAMRILDTLSKPQQDPSPKLGFWDKIGLVLHVSMKMAWKHDGDMHVTLKGSRDPYVVMGTGAGLTKVFRGNVRWHIGVCPDSRKLMEVMCDEYMLAISDFSRRNATAGAPRPKANELSTSKNSLHHHHLSRKEISFQKILMKLTGDVRWTAGLAFERHCESKACTDCNGEEQCRLWNFVPHWEVKLRIPEYSILPGGKIRDAFKGYRSHYIHGQISVTSRKRTDGGESYNTMHLTPKSFAHFFDWIHSFSGNLSLPIRAGPLFPSAEGPKQKLGQHLMTLKYNLRLEPLYLSHVYRSANTEDPTKIDMTGVKAKIDSFTLDLHQRKEERVVTNKQLETQRTSSHMAIYRGQVDLRTTDLRAMTAVFEVDHNEETQRSQFQKDPLDPIGDPRGEFAARLGDFDVPDEDVQWIDMDDFTEIDTLLPEKSPTCRIIPLAYAPRFVYDRDTTHLEGKSLNDARDNIIVPGQRFGFEKTHFCSMVKDDGQQANADLGEAQTELWRMRRDFLDSELKRNQEHIEKLKDELCDTPNSQALNEEQKLVKEHDQMLKEKLNFVDNLKSNIRKLYANEVQAVQAFESDDTDTPKLDDGIDFMKRVKEEVRTFNNRFIVHDIQMKWNNTLRNILIRYIQQVNQRRGFSYYMSQKAVRFLTDLVEEQLRHKHKAQDGSVDENDDDSGDIASSDISDDRAEEDKNSDEIEQLIKRLLEDRGDNFFVPDETAQKQHESEQAPTSLNRDEDLTNNLHEDYEAVNNYIVRLIAPQIQLQSEKNEDAVIILAAQSMQMKILAIQDKTIAGDDVSALVQRKFSVQMTSAQFFYAHQSGFHGAIANLLTQNSYGAKQNTYWPPWVPIESVYDFENSPRAFERIVDRTSALCTYIKNNQLRIKKTDHVNQENHLSARANDDQTDSITVNFPKFNLAADSTQYYAMFTIAMDLLLYSEPLQKQRNEQIEKILLAADFSDLSGAPEMVSSLQKRIRSMNDFKAQFRQHAQANDPQCRQDELRVAKELEQCEDELFFLMKSVATAQQKHEDRDSEVIPAMRWHLKAEEILWHLMEGKKAFIDFGLSKASFKRTDNSDSSNYNTLEIEMMQGINLSPDPVFAQLFAPYFGTDRTVLDARRSKMVRIYWYMLEAIGGISVCDHFEVNLFPLRLQMEHHVGKKLFAYVFPDKQNKNDKSIKSAEESDSENEDGSDTSSMDDDDDNASRVSSTSRGMKHKPSKLSLRALKHSTSLSRLGHGGSPSQTAPDSSSMYSQDADSRASSRRLSRSESTSSLQRTATNHTSKAVTSTKKKNASKGSSDDLSAMLSRASKNMSLVYVKVPSVVLALSYKGAKAKNFVDVTDFVFKMPTIEYRNKTWSYLDLAEHLKREVIKAVLAHTGSLLRDKMTHYRKSKGHQATMTKQLTSYRTFMPAEMSEKKYTETLDVPNGRHSLEHEKMRADYAMQHRTSTAETSSFVMEGDHHGHGLFNNAIGRHIQHLSHIARHKDGLAEDNAESTMKKTRMLLGKFIEKAK